MSEVRVRRLRAVEPSGAVDLPYLLNQSGRGDEAAFSQLYDELSGVVYGVVIRVIRDQAQAAELTQEVFVEAWRLAARFDSDKGSVRSWICTIAHRRAVDRVRSEQSRRNREEADLIKTPVVAADAAVESAERNSDVEMVQQALQVLTVAQRESVTLAYYGGHTYREVAALLDIPEGTVKTRIRDGLIKLRDTMGLDQ